MRMMVQERPVLLSKQASRRERRAKGSQPHLEDFCHAGFREDQRQQHGLLIRPLLCKGKRNTELRIPESSVKD